MSIAPDFPPADTDTATKPSRSAGKNSAAEQGRNTPMGWKPTPNEPIPVVRCTGTVRNGPNAGGRCPNWSLRGATVCTKHGGQLPNVREHAAAVVESARLRIIGLSDNAVDVLEELLDPNTGPAIRLKAATELLDRAGIKGPVEVKVEVTNATNPSETINDRLAQIAARLSPKPAEPEPEDLGEMVDESEM